MPRIVPCALASFVALLLIAPLATGQEAADFEILIFPPGSESDVVAGRQMGGLVHAGHFALQIRALSAAGETVRSFSGTVELSNIEIKNPQGKWVILDRSGPFTEGILHHKRVRLRDPTTPRIQITSPVITQREFSRLPGWFSLIPSIIAVLLALVFRQVLVALILAIWSGAFLLQPSFSPGSALFALQRVFDTYLVDTLAGSSDHVKVLLFSLALGGMVGILSRSGGMLGVAHLLSRFARGPRSAQLATFGMGSVIFFDDYANSLLVGNSMRPLTDRLRISREKLAYLVDSTAAPIAGIALISTWIGFELGRIEDAFRIASFEGEPYVAFLRSIPYRFYSLLTLVFVFLVSLLLRDFGPMRRAERRARLEGKPLRDGAAPLVDRQMAAGEVEEGVPCRAINGLLPIFFLIALTAVALFWSGVQNLEAGGELLRQVPLSAEDTQRMTVQHDTGHAAGLVFGSSLPWRDRLVLLGQIISMSSSYDVLLWSAFAGSLFAGILVCLQRIQSVAQVLQAWVAGVGSLTMAALILISAWAIGSICHDLSTAQWVTHALGNSVPSGLLPAASFLVAAGIAFATGSSWTTMAILFPVLVPLAIATTGGADHILYSTIGAILAGGILGDHCSPISDTTILSSMASGSDHIDHVRTQLPYALTTGAVALLFGYLPAGLWGDKISPWILLGVGSVVILIILLVLGRRADLVLEEEEEEEEPIAEDQLLA